MCSVPEDFDSTFQLAKNISVFMFQSSSHLCMKTETVLCHLKSLIGHPQGWKIPWKYCNIFIYWINCEYGWGSVVLEFNNTTCLQKYIIKLMSLSFNYILPLHMMAFIDLLLFTILWNSMEKMLKKSRH